MAIVPGIQGLVQHGLPSGMAFNEVASGGSVTPSS